VVGLIVWIGCERFYADAAIPPQLAGLIASFAGMIVGSLAGGTVPHEAAAGSRTG
jgi:hypothetical protein